MPQPPRGEAMQGGDPESVGSGPSQAGRPLELLGMVLEQGHLSEITHRLKARSNLVGKFSGIFEERDM